MGGLAAVFNVCAVLGLVFSAILAAELKDPYVSAAALGAAGFFAALVFLILHAPGAAVAKVLVGAAAVPLLLIVTIRKIGKGDGK